MVKKVVPNQNNSAVVKHRLAVMDKKLLKTKVDEIKKKDPELAGLLADILETQELIVQWIGLQK